MNESAGTKHILVVEDDESFRRMVTRMLEGAGYEVTSTQEFNTAITVIESGKPIDLLLSDVGMPQGTPHGFAIALMAQKRRPDMRVILMSGTYDPSILGRLASEFVLLQKPFTAEALVRTVQSVLGQLPDG